MIVNILYDSRRMEKWEPLMKELEIQGITEYAVWEPVYCPESIIKSINLSHKRIVQAAKDRNLPEIAVFEDDIQFACPGAWKHFLDGIPAWPFDIYLGGTYGLNRPITGKTDKINGLHCFIIRQRFYDAFLSVPEDQHIDVALDGKGLYYVEYPFIALQRPGWSSNSRAFSDKNLDLFPEDIYKG